MKKLLLLLLVLPFMSCLAFAQDVPPVADVVTPAAQSPLLLIIAALSPLVIQMVKLIVPTLPKWSLPIAAPLLGMLADYIGSLISGGTATPLVGAALGLAGVGVRELIDQVGGRLVNGKATTLLLVAILSLGAMTGCVTGERLESGGAYAQTQTSRAIPQLFTLDASFDMAYSALDVTFKYERNNRLTLWNLSPNIKHNLDKLRVEASRVKKDYAIARKSYLSNPTPAGLDAISASLNEFLKVNAAALEVIQSKGVQIQ